MNHASVWWGSMIALPHLNNYKTKDMVNTFGRFLSLALVLAFTLSCSDEEHVSTHHGDAEIDFQVEQVYSRGFIDSDNLKTIGTGLSVYGFHNEKIFFDGTSMSMKDKNLEYDIVDGEARWIIKDGDTPVKYYWLDNGKYKFFGWLKHDKASGLTLPESWTFDETTQCLTIPEMVVDKDYNQFDFIYSDVHVRELDENTTDEVKQMPVPFVLHHLFASFGVGIRNSSEEDVTITKVALEGIHDKGGATIDYSDDISGVEYTETTLARSSGTPFIAYNGSGYLLPKEVGVVGDAFTGVKDKIYYMVWPQDKEVVAPTTPVTDVEGREYADTDSLLVVEFMREGEKYGKRIKLPEVAWEPGKKYHLEIQIADKLVELKVTVNPWGYTSASMDFSEEAVAIKEGGHLAWDENTCIKNDTEMKVYVNQGQPIEASFALDAPQGGQWRVSLEGDVTAFKILDDSAPVEDGIGPIDGTSHRIRIVPQINNPERQYTATLKFVVLTAEGKVLSVDDLVQDINGDEKPDLYTIVLQSN